MGLISWSRCSWRLYLINLAMDKKNEDEDGNKTVNDAINGKKPSTY